MVFVEKENGFSRGVMYSCIVGGLNQMIFTSLIDLCSVTQPLRKMYFCCLVILLYLTPLVLFLAMLAKLNVIPIAAT